MGLLKDVSLFFKIWEGTKQKELISVELNGQWLFHLICKRLPLPESVKCLSLALGSYSYIFWSQGR